MSKSQADVLRTWIKPKQVAIQAMKQKIESTELMLKHTRDNIKNGLFIEQVKKNILEAQNDFEKKKEEFELEKLKVDIEHGFLTKGTEIALEKLYVDLKIEETSLEEIKKAIKKAERNHDVKEVDGVCTFCKGKGCEKCAASKQGKLERKDGNNIKKKMEEPEDETD